MSGHTHIHTTTVNLAARMRAEGSLHIILRNTDNIEAQLFIGTL